MKIKLIICAVLVILAASILVSIGLPKRISNSNLKRLAFPSSNISIESIKWIEGETNEVVVSSPSGKFESYALFNSNMQNLELGDDTAKLFKQFAGKIVEQTDSAKIFEVLEKSSKDGTLGFDYFVLDKEGGVSILTKNEKKRNAKKATLFSFGASAFTKPEEIKTFQSKKLASVTVQPQNLKVQNLKSNLIVVFYDKNKKPLKVAKEISMDSTAARAVASNVARASVPSASAASVAASVASASSVSAVQPSSPAPLNPPAAATPTRLPITEPIIDDSELAVTPTVEPYDPYVGTKRRTPTPKPSVSPSPTPPPIKTVLGCGGRYTGQIEVKEDLDKDLGHHCPKDEADYEAIRKDLVGKCGTALKEQAANYDTDFIGKCDEKWCLDQKGLTSQNPSGPGKGLCVNSSVRGDGSIIALWTYKALTDAQNPSWALRIKYEVIPDDAPKGTINCFQAYCRAKKGTKIDAYWFCTDC
jgi:hypothetical protein